MQEDQLEFECQNVQNIIKQFDEYPEKIVLYRHGWDLSHLISILNECPVSDFLPDEQERLSIPTDKEIFEKVFRSMMEINPKTFEELIWIYKSTCAAFLLKDELLSAINGYNLLQRTFLLNTSEWELCPVHIHMICEALFNIMKDSKDVLYFSRKINPISVIAFNVSICLVWAAVYRELNRDVKMFRFHEFSELVDMLQTLNVEFLKANLDATYTLFQLLSFLQNVIIMQKSNEKIKHRFKHFFTYTAESLAHYKSWCAIISRTFEVNANKACEIRDYSLLYELVEIDMLGSLENISCDDDGSSRHK